MMLFDREINLRDITIPFCNVAALFDHIVPFPNALSTAYLIGTPPEKQRTIIVEGGHVRGVVNHVLYPVLEEFTRQHSGYNGRPVQRLLSKEQELHEPIMKELSPASLFPEMPGGFQIAA